MHFDYNESENLTDSSLHHIFESENFRFTFFYEKMPNLRSEVWEISKLKKMVGNSLDTLLVIARE